MKPVAKKPRKPYTPEQKAARAAKERERYQAARAAGLSPKEAKSIRKTIEQKPELIQKSGVRDLLRELGGATQAPAAKIPYAEFVAKNPQIKSANKAMEEYRKAGGSIGSERGKDIYRTVHNIPKQHTKRTRIKYLSKDQVQRRYLVPNRYIYLVRYEVEREDQTDTYTDYLTIRSNVALNMREVREATESAFIDGMESDSEKYKAIAIQAETIELIYAVDQQK